MVEIQIDPAERLPGALPGEKVNAALAVLAEDGVVVLKNSADVENVDALGHRMIDDLARFEADHELANNFQGVRQPPFHPWLFRDLVYNEPAITISHRILGDGITLTSYGSNTAFIGSGFQKVHADSAAPKPGQGPCTHIVINVPLVDMTLENGATRYWPGSHKDGRIYASNRHPTEAMLVEQEARRPAEQTIAQRGDTIVRDMRVWHGGVPNTSSQHRPMLALVHANTHPGKGTFEAEEGSEDFWQHSVLDAAPLFVPKPIDYLTQGHSRPHLPPPSGRTDLPVGNDS